DMRASAAYRLQVAGNLLERLWLETRRDAPLAEAEVNVWARILAPALFPGLEGVNPGDRR
ncbi:MAG: hypothetical protein ACM3N6_13640, partial [Betaproteobacteria bacterium]